MPTYIRKDYRGNWSAVDEIDLGDDQVLTIRTSKSYSGNLITTASVGLHKDGTVTHIVYQDFTKCIYARKVARITSKVVEAQHAEAMATLDSIKSLVASHYALEAA